MSCNRVKHGHSPKPRSRKPAPLPKSLSSVGTMLGMYDKESNPEGRTFHIGLNWSDRFHMQPVLEILASNPKLNLYELERVVAEEGGSIVDIHGIGVLFVVSNNPDVAEVTKDGNIVTRETDGCYDAPAKELNEKELYKQVCARQKLMVAETEAHNATEAKILPQGGAGTDNWRELLEQKEQLVLDMTDEQLAALTDEQLEALEKYFE